MGTQQLSLKRSNFLPDMLNSLKYLFSNQSLVDVTLACEGHSLKVHKLILAAYSPFFQNLFSETPCSHPIVFMKNVKFADLKIIVDFMYRGEVNVSQHQLASVVKTAQELHVQGLEEVSSDERQMVVEENVVEVDMTNPSDNFSVEHIDNMNTSSKNGNKTQENTLCQNLRSEKQHTESELVLSEFPAFIEEIKTEIESSDDEYETNDADDYIQPQVSSVYSEYRDASMQESDSLNPSPSLQDVSANTDELATCSNQIYNDEVAHAAAENNVQLQDTDSTSRKMTTRSASRPKKTDKNDYDAKIHAPCTSTSEYVNSLLSAGNSAKDIKAFSLVSREESSIFTMPSPSNEENCAITDQLDVSEPDVPIISAADEYSSNNLTNEDEVQETICVEPDIFIPSGDESGFSHSNTSYQSLYVEDDQNGPLNEELIQEQGSVGQDLITFGASGYLEYATDSSGKKNPFENLEYATDSSGRKNPFGNLEYAIDSSGKKNPFGNLEFATDTGKNPFGNLEYATDNSEKNPPGNLNDENKPVISLPITEEEKPKDTIRRPKKYKLGTSRRRKAIHKPFACDICHKRFRYDSALVIHRRVHTGEKPFPCGVCDKWFARKDHAQVHQQVHNKSLHRKQEIIEYETGGAEGLLSSSEQVESSYICDICNKRFRHSTHLERHKMIHTEEKPFCCDVCNKTFLLRNSYLYHMKSHRKSSSNTETDENASNENNIVKKPRIRFNGAKFSKSKCFPCPVCKKKFQEKSRLIRHEVVHSEEKPFSCDACGKTFRRKDNLKSHVQTHIRRMLAFKKESGEHNTEGTVSNKRYRSSIDQTKLKAIIKRFVCNICSKRFRYNSELLTHRRTHTGEKPFGCEVCGKKFAHNANLRLHQFSHMGYKPHSCTQCGSEFLQKYQLAKHLKCCKGEKLHACNLCNRSFPRAELQSHLERHAGREPFTCELCGKSFSYQYQLDKHTKACKGEVLHPCHICNRSFSNDDLKSHLERHAGRLPFICDLCSKSFAYKYQLDSHLRSCKGEKLQSCHICHRSYTSDDLACHLERHAGRLPFVCDLCGKGFSYRYMLDTHSKICKGERTHTCHICNRSFNSDDLQSHLERHAGKLPFVCDLCGKGFSYKFKLIRHRETHVKEKFTCDKCGKVFNQATRLSIHAKTHSSGNCLQPEDNLQDEDQPTDDLPDDANEESDADQSQVFELDFSVDQDEALHCNQIIEEEHNYDETSDVEIVVD